MMGRGLVTVRVTDALGGESGGGGGGILVNLFFKLSDQDRNFGDGSK